MNIATALFVYTLAAFGLAYVVGHAKISRRIREILAGRMIAVCPVCGVKKHLRYAFPIPGDPDGGPGVCSGTNEDDAHERAEFHPAFLSPTRGFVTELIECPACFGWWTGLVTGAVVALLDAGNLCPWWRGAIILAFYTAGTNFALARATGLTPNPQDE